MKKLILFSIFLSSLFSCVSIAKISELPMEKDAIDFAKHRSNRGIIKNKNWSNRTEFSYYLTLNKIPKDTVLLSIFTALKREGYSIRYTSPDKDVVLARRGLRANEWATVSGVYLNFQMGYSEIYIKSKITQDITGGWSNDRAEEIGLLICKSLGGCVDSFSVKD